MKRTLSVIAVAAGLAACSSSSTTDGGPDAGPCQTAQVLLDPGDCAAVIDAGTLNAFTITPVQRAACESACTSASDLTAVIDAFGCLNAIPVDAGACTSANKSNWLNLVGSKGVGCEVALRNAASADCFSAVTTTGDGG